MTATAALITEVLNAQTTNWQLLLYVCDAQALRHQTCGYLPSHRVSLLFDQEQYILLDDRGMHVNNFLKAATWMWNGRESSR